MMKQKEGADTEPAEELKWSCVEIRAGYERVADQHLEKERSFTTDCWRYQFVRSEWAAEPGPEEEGPDPPDTGPMPFLGLSLQGDKDDLSCEQGIFGATWAFVKFVFGYKKPYWALAWKLLGGLNTAVEPVVFAGVVARTGSDDSDLIGSSGLLLLLYVFFGLFQQWLTWKFNVDFPEASVRMDLRNIYHKQNMKRGCKNPDDAGRDMYNMDTLCAQAVDTLWGGFFTLLGLVVSFMASSVATAHALRSASQSYGAVVALGHATHWLTPFVAFQIHQAGTLRTARRYFQQCQTALAVVGMNDEEPMEKNEKNKMKQMQQLFQRVAYIRFLRFFQYFLADLSAQQLQRQLALLVHLGAVVILVGYFPATSAGDLTYVLTAMSAVQAACATLMSTLIGFTAGYPALLSIVYVFNSKERTDKSSEVVETIAPTPEFGETTVEAGPTDSQI